MAKIMFLHVLFLFICTSLSSFQNGVVATNWKLSKREDIELERQLKRLNKPPIKTIHTDNGDIYDCMSFYQQPAFDHPLLKNHTYKFEMETNIMHNETENQILSEFLQNFGPKNEECPIGTVIIKRVTKEDLIRHKFASNLRSRAKSLAVSNSDVHVGAVRTLLTLDKYAGAAANIGIYNPPVTGPQYSTAKLLVLGGNDVIEIGWRVDPALNKNSKTHIFIHTDASEIDSHCFGTLCPGFVVTSRTLNVDSYFVNTVTEKGGLIFVFKVDISREPTTGNWVLRVGPYNRIKLGYWPKEIFSQQGLGDLAAYIEWAGEVYAPIDYPNTIMGFGNAPTRDLKETAFISKLTYRDENNQEMIANNTEPYADIDNYQVIDFEDDNFGHIMFYGGPVLDN